MRLVIIFLNKVEFLEDLMTAFLEVGIPGATVLDSEGMGHIIADNIPIFAGLRDAFAGSSLRNRTIITAVSAEKVEVIKTVVEDICGSLSEPGVGPIITLPVDQVFGLRTEEDVE
jgi:nitrogen regulatory protein PII